MFSGGIEETSDMKSVSWLISFWFNFNKVYVGFTIS